MDAVVRADGAYPDAFYSFDPKRGAMGDPKTSPGSRRSLLASAASGAAVLAGCLGGIPVSTGDGNQEGGDGTEEREFPEHPGEEPREPPEGRRCDGPCGMEPAKYPDTNAQIAHEDGQGVFFDTPGCLVAYHHDPAFYDGPDAAIENVWVRDFETEELLDGTEAHFVLDFSKDRHEETMAHNPKPFANWDDAVDYVDSYDDLGTEDIVDLEAFGAEEAHRYRDYPLSEDET